MIQVDTSFSDFSDTIRFISSNSNPYRPLHAMDYELAVATAVSWLFEKRIQELLLSITLHGLFVDDVITEATKLGVCRDFIERLKKVTEERLGRFLGLT